MAASLAAEIARRLNLKPQLIEGRGGVFDVKAEGRLIFSRKQTGRFPEHEEVIRTLESMKAA